MPVSEIDDYLAGVAEPDRDALEHIRQLVKLSVPQAEEGKSYGMPALKYNKRPLIGFVAARKHLSLFPFSPAVIEALSDRLDGFALSKGTIRFTADKPIPDNLLRDIVMLRLAEIS